ncbi:hypothetical protein ACR0W7_002435 [Vibrio cholerae]
MTTDYQNRASSLVAEVKSVLEAAIDEARTRKLSITVRQRGDSVLLWKVLETVMIDEDIFEYIFSIPNKAKAKPTLSTMGSLLRTFSSLKQVKEHLIQAAIDIRSISLDSDQIDYIKELHHCYVIAGVYLKASRQTKRSKDEHFQEYCSLCWRLVHKYKRLNFSEEEYSNHYCKYHHPKENDSIYHRDRRKVLSAARKRKDKIDIASLSVIKNPSTSRSKSARTLYHLTSSFAESYRKGIADLNLPVNSSTSEIFSELLRVSSAYYPEAYLRIKQIETDETTEWKELFKSIIKSLDPLGYDVVSWDDTNELSIGEEINTGKETKLATDSPIDWRVVLNIIHRFQSFSNVSAQPQPRGPKKGNVPKNDILREKIVQIATQQLKKGAKVNASSIAREVGLSPQRVCTLIKELGLR